MHGEVPKIKNEASETTFEFVIFSSEISWKFSVLLKDKIIYRKGGAKRLINPGIFATRRNRLVSSINPWWTWLYCEAPVEGRAGIRTLWTFKPVISVRYLHAILFREISRQLNLILTDSKILVIFVAKALWGRFFMYIYNR